MVLPFMWLKKNFKQMKIKCITRKEIGLLIVLALIVSAFLNLAFAQVLFSKTKIKIKNNFINIELAKSEEQQQRGLMHRKKLAQNDGMLFQYEEEEVRHFWMKNTFIPLSIGFFDKNKRLVDAQEMTPVVSEQQENIPKYQSSRPAKYALEMSKGWFTSHQIHMGDTFDFVSEKKK
jgi:uncharacterized membrane protein (UPF0127 family)